VANAELAVGLARDIAATVAHRRIHIGGDEPFELGKGASAADVAARGRDHVYLEHLTRIIEPLVADGHEVMFWADLFRRDATLLPDIPSGAIGVVWNYEAPSEATWMDLLNADQVRRLGLPDDAHIGFEAHARLFIESGTPFWVAPGTSTWNTIIGRNVNAEANIADAVTVGRANSCPGLLLTDWGDNGHWQPLPVSLPSIVRCGVAARTGELPSDTEVATAIDDIAGFHPGTGSLIDRLGRIGESLGVAAPNGSPLCSAMSTGGFPILGEPDVDAFVAGHSLLGEALQAFSADSVGGPRGETVAAEMHAACRLASLGLRRVAAAHDIEIPGPSPAVPTTSEIDSVAEALRKAWSLSSRPGGLDDSIARIRR
jgi:hexosaminidase